MLAARGVVFVAAGDIWDAVSGRCGGDPPDPVEDDVDGDWRGNLAAEGAGDHQAVPRAEAEPDVVSAGDGNVVTREASGSRLQESK